MVVYAMATGEGERRWRVPKTRERNGSNSCGGTISLTRENLAVLCWQWTRHFHSAGVDHLVLTFHVFLVSTPWSESYRNIDRLHYSKWIFQFKSKSILSTNNTWFQHLENQQCNLFRPYHEGEKPSLPMTTWILPVSIKKATSTH